MTYVREFYGSGRVTELTALQAQDELTGFYKPNFVEYLFTHGIHFRMPLGIGEIYTRDENGMVPQAGFYGTIEEVPDFD